MTDDGARLLAIVAIAVVSPVMVALIVAMVRGYTIDVHMRRRRNRGEGEEDE